MSITMTGAGGIFTRIGKLVRAINVIGEFRGGAGSALAEDLPTLIATCMTQVDGASNEIRGAYSPLLTALTSQVSTLQTLPAALQTAAVSQLIEQVYADVKLSTKDTVSALTQLIAQMKAGGYYVTPNVIAVTPTAGGGNIGNGNFVSTSKDPNGFESENAFVETIRFTVTGNASTGSENLRARGELAAASRLAADWPSGSGSDQSHTVINAATGSNKLANGTFEAFTVSNTPDSWTLTSGVAGTEYFSEGSVVYAGTKSLKLAGSATLVNMSQVVTGLTSRGTYAVNFWTKVSSVPTTGVLTIDLYDPLAAAVISDEAGNNNSFTVSLPACTTSFVAKSGVFRIPDPLPATVQLRVRMTTALDVGKSCYIDHMALAQVTRQYTGGPAFAIFAGATNFSGDDTFTVAVNNTLAGLWQTAAQRLYGMTDLGLILPSIGSTLVNNTLIT